MGMLVNGKWSSEDQLRNNRGRFVRPESSFRSWVTNDGKAGPTGEAGFKAEAGRYHLYISLSCPFAHRTAIMHCLKKLENVVSVSIAAGRNSKGWIFKNETKDHRESVFSSNYLHEVYASSDPQFTGRATVPVLWDKQQGIIVSNESSDITRMFNSAFNAFTANRVDYYPEALRCEINKLNDTIFKNVNIGVYKAGFAKTQKVFNDAFDKLFNTLELLDKWLGKKRYLVGDKITEADWRLFTTLVRFDLAYHSAFKCNKQRLVDYQNLWPYTRELYQIPGVAETVNVPAIKKGYHTESPLTNPLGIIPKGPYINFDIPHYRGTH